MPAFARNDLYAVFNHITQTEGRQSINGDDVHDYLIRTFNWIPRPLPEKVLVSSQGAFSFALANHPQADGGFSRAAIAHPMRGNNPTFAFSFPPHNRVFVDGWRVGWGYIKDDPRTWLGPADHVANGLQQLAVFAQAVFLEVSQDEMDVGVRCRARHLVGMNKALPAGGSVRCAGLRG